MTRTPRIFSKFALAGFLSVCGLPAVDAIVSAAPAAAPAAGDAPAAPAPAAPGDEPTSRPAARPRPQVGAPDAAPATAPADAAPPMELTEKEQNQSLADDVDDFWHYGKIANYRAAVAFANKILARPEPEVEKLRAFETAASAHNDVLDDWLLRWESVDTADMKGAAAKLEALLTKGRTARRTDKDYILTNIKALAVNERAYRIHIERLRETGELAVQYMIDLLRSSDPNDLELKDPIRRGLVDLGRGALNPLLAATETKDEELKLTLIGVLARIGYDVSVPYLARIAEDKTHPGLADAANMALRRMGAKPGSNVADQFYRLSEKFYYGNASIQPDMKAPFAYMWYWTDQGLRPKEVPPQIFSDLMAEREAEYALQLGPGTRDALSLWLAANNKIELDLPEGKTNDAFEKDRPGADYYNVYAGAQYLDAALTRSLEDRNAGVAVKLIKSLAEIVGPSTQGSSASIDPLVASMHYADRVVRFEAAFALASGLPNTSFPGHEQVAPLLAEAVSQNGSANIVVIAASQGEEQKLLGDLKQYGLASGIDPRRALNNSMKLPSIDVIVMTETLNPKMVDEAYQLAAGGLRTSRAGKVIVTASKLSPFAQRYLSDPLTVVTQANDAAGLAAAVEEARKRAGGLPLDDKVATEYAVKGARMLERLAEGRVSAFDLSVTQPTLLASLNDTRGDVVKAVGDALSYMNGDQIQLSLLTVAVGEKTPDDVRVSLLKSLARNAKFFGNRLSEQGIGDLQKQVDSAANLEVRTAAAEARGALNLSADQAKELIVKQAKR